MSICNTPYAIRRAHYPQACLSSSAPEDIIVCIPLSLRAYNMSRGFIRLYAVKDVRHVYHVLGILYCSCVCPQDSQGVCDHYVVRPRLCADVHVARPRRRPRVSGRIRPRDMVVYVLCIRTGWGGSDICDIGYRQNRIWSR